MDKRIILIIFLFSFLGVAFYTGFKYTFYADQALPNPSIESFYSGFFVWQQNFYSGYFDSINVIPNIIIYAIVYPFYKIFGLRIYFFLLDLIPVLVGSFGSFFLIFELLKGYDKRSAIAVGLLSSFIMSFTWTVFVPQITEISFVPFLLLFIYKELDYINKSKAIRKDYLALSIILLSFEIVYAGTTSIIPLFLIISLIIVFMIILSKNLAIRVRYLLFGFVLLVLGFLIDFTSLLTTELISNIYKLDYLHQVNVNVNYNLARNFVLFLSGGTNNNHLASLFQVFLFIFAFYGFYKISKTKDYFKTAKAYVVSIFGSLILIIFLYILSNKNGSFSPLYKFFETGIPNQFNYIYLFGILSNAFIILYLSILVPIAIAFVFNPNKKVLYSFAFIIAVAYFILYAYAPISTGYVAYLKNNMTIPNGVSNIPNHVFEVSNYINSKMSNKYSALTLPQTYYWSLEKWYNGSDVYGSLINVPVYTGYFGFTPYGEYFFPYSMNLAYLETMKLDNSSILNSRPSNIYGILGIKYIIVQGDAVNTSNFASQPAGKFSFSKIYNNLNSSKGFEFVIKYNKTSIYLNKNVVPFVYSSNIVDLKNLSDTELDNFIGNSSFNISKDLVFMHRILGFGVSGGPYFGKNVTFNFTPPLIDNFSKPKISFVENTPTKVTVRISNATTPYYLVFRETYDPHWAAFYSNGAEVNPHDHIAVNGFANAWYMNKTGNYTVTLYYTLQKDAWIAWGVSFAALFVTVGIGVYGWKELAKAKMRRHG